MAKNRIKELRKAQKLTLKNLVELLAEKGIKVNESQLSKFEKGTSSPRSKMADDFWSALAEIFDTNIPYLLEIPNSKPSRNPSSFLPIINNELNEIEELLLGTYPPDELNDLLERQENLLELKKYTTQAIIAFNEAVKKHKEVEELKDYVKNAHELVAVELVSRLSENNLDTWMSVGLALLNTQDSENEIKNNEE